MTEYEIKESEFLSASDVKGKDGVVIEILSEAKDETTIFGVKSQANVKLTIGSESTNKIMNINQGTMNALIRKEDQINSTKWIGYKFVPKVENISGNDAIFVEKFV